MGRRREAERGRAEARHGPRSDRRRRARRREAIIALSQPRRQRADGRIARPGRVDEADLLGRDGRPPPAAGLHDKSVRAPLLDEIRAKPARAATAASSARPGRSRRVSSRLGAKQRSPGKRSSQPCGSRRAKASLRSRTARPGCRATMRRAAGSGMGAITTPSGSPGNVSGKGQGRARRSAPTSPPRRNAPNAARHPPPGRGVRAGSGRACGRSG